MISFNSVRKLTYYITTNKVSKFRILYTFEDCELKYTLKMIESVGSKNILFRFMNASVSLSTLQSYSIKVQKGLIYVKMIVLSSGMSKTPVYDLDQLSPSR